MTADTPNYGLSRIATGEQITRQGNAYTDRDRLTIDLLLEALRNHSHSGDGRLPDPSGLPALTLLNGAGSLAADTTYYYRVSLIDKWGLETAASTETSVTTTSGLTVDDPPSLTLSAGGSLAPSTYGYVFTWVSTAGGESLPSPVSQVVITTAGSDRTVTVTIPTLPSDAAQANIYRTRIGLSNYYLVGSTTSTSFVDSGLPDDCCGATPPSVNTAAVNNTIDIAPADADQATGALFWRAYRTTVSGVYLTNSLVAQVPIGETISDAGGDLLPGMPKSVSSTIGDSPALDDPVQGTRVLSVCLPEILESGDPAGTDSWQMYLAETLRPTRVALACGTAPTGRDTTPVDFVLESTGGGDGATLTMDDNSGLYVAQWPADDEVFFGMDAWPYRYADVIDQPDLYAGYVVVLDAHGTYAGLLARDIREEIAVDPGAWEVEILAKGTATLTVKNYETTTPAETLLWTGAEITVADDSNYVWYSAGDFTTATAASLYHKITLSAVTGEVSIAGIRYTASRPALNPGQVTFRHGTVSGGTIGDKFTLTIWY